MRASERTAAAWAVLLLIVTFVLVLAAIWAAPGLNFAARLGWTAGLTGVAAVGLGLWVVRP